jgi:putative hemolysin
MIETDNFYINLQEILRTKAPKAAKRIPRFIVGILAKLVHQDDINDFLKYNGGATGIGLMNNAMDYFKIRLQVRGTENLPDPENRCIFASNHPLGGLDGICLSSYLGNRYDGKIKYLVNDILYFIKPLQPVFIPVNKHGAQGRTGVQTLNEALASDVQIITFPAGLCSRKEKGVICDTEWKKMFITKAVECQRDIVPVFFEARNSSFFYRLASIRKKSGVKFNIEMLFLPRELFRAVGSTFTVYFGKPIPWQTFDSSKSPQQWADWVKEIVYNTLN